MFSLVNFVPVVFKHLTQIREHVAAVVIVPQAGAVERVKLCSREGGGRDRQSDRLVQTLQAGQTDSSLPGLIRVLIAITTAAFHTGAERRIVAAMRNQVTNNHFTLFCHEYCSPD